MQAYANHSEKAIEAKYVFPLDESAAVCGFEAFINNKHVVGKVCNVNCVICQVIMTRKQQNDPTIFEANCLSLLVLRSVSKKTFSKKSKESVFNSWGRTQNSSTHYSHTID